MGIIEMIQLGGPIAIVIAGVYLIGLVITFERMIYFFQTKGSYRYFSEKLDHILVKQTIQLKEVTDHYFTEHTKSSYFTVVHEFLRRRFYPKVILEKHLKQTAQRRVHEMESSLWVLTLIAQLAPLAGLLGTMTGLIQSFKGIQELSGQVDISVLAGGIWEAMLTTVVGIVVAIFTMIAYRFLDNVVEKRANQLEDMITHIIVHHRSLAPEISQ